MLTYDEAKDCLNETLKISPEDFERLVADHVPQTVLHRLIEDVFDHNLRKTGHSQAAVVLTTASMTGFQLGWMLAVRSVREGEKP